MILFPLILGGGDKGAEEVAVPSFGVSTDFCDELSGTRVRLYTIIFWESQFELLHTILYVLLTPLAEDGVSIKTLLGSPSFSGKIETIASTTTGSLESEVMYEILRSIGPSDTYVSTWGIKNINYCFIKAENAYSNRLFN